MEDITGKKCVWCKKQLSYSYSIRNDGIKRGYVRKTCSDECFRNWARQVATKNIKDTRWCKFCNTKFSYDRYGVSVTGKYTKRDRNFCSKKCHRNHIRKILVGKRISMPKGFAQMRSRMMKKFYEEHPEQKYIRTKKANIKFKELIKKGILPRHDVSGKNNPMYGRSPINRRNYKRFKVYSPLQGEIFLRSSYEKIYFDYLIRNNIKFLYEPTRFEIDDNHTYTPDFYLIDSDEWIEIKGYYNEADKNKVRAMKKKYGIDIIVLRKEDIYKLKNGI